MDRFSLSISVVFGFALWLACSAAFGQGNNGDTQRRALVVYSDHSALTANIEIAEGLREAFSQTLSPRIETYTAYRDGQRFPGAEAERRFIDELARRYERLPIDIVISIGPAALDLVLRHKARFAPDAPVLAGGVSTSSLERVELPPDVSAVTAAFEAAETIELARRAQPSARRLVVFSGSAAFDDSWQETVRDHLESDAFADLDATFVSDLTLDRFISEAAALDPDTILLILTIFEDAAGDRFTPHQAASAIAARPSAPPWGVYNTYVGDGDGVIGGVFETFESIGRTVGDLAVGIMNGEVAPGARVRVPPTPVVDWIQLTRFGLDADLLPPDTILLNYSPPVWQSYRIEILAILAILVAQSAMIGALVVQGRRRRAAEQEVAERRLELTQMSRISQLGELSGAITHELNQPLTAILANAEAGLLLLSRSPPDLEEVSGILRDIAADDERAANILSGLRRLMRRSKVEPEPVDLNAVVHAVESLTHSEMLMRGVRLVVRVSKDPLVVLGDTGQFQQVLLNLLLNAADAIVTQPEESRSILVETMERTDGWRQIAVQDRGPGLAAEVVDDPFRAFATTKEHGMGIGLSICRGIAEAYGGELSFEDVDEGARIFFALPPA